MGEGRKIKINGVEREVFDFCFYNKPFYSIKIDANEDIIVSGDSDLGDFMCWYSKLRDFRNFGLNGSNLDTEKYVLYQGWWVTSSYASILPATT